MAKAKDLIALAGLAGLAYANRDKLFGGKDKDKGPSATAEEEEASKVRMDAQKNAVSGNRVTDTGDETDRLLARSPTPDYSNEGRNKPLKVSTPVTRSIRSGKSAAEAVAPANSTSSAAVVNENPNGTIEAPAASNRTDAMRNASRAAAAADRRRRMAQPTLMKKGGMTSSASSRADGIASRGKTRGKIC